LYPVTPDEVLADQLSATEWLALPTPEPVTDTAGAVFVALLTTVIVELNVPALFGANTIFMMALCPAANVAPLMPLVTLYADEPLMLTPEMVTLEFPLLIRATESVSLFPTVSLPKSSFEVDDIRLFVDPEPAPARITDSTVVPLLVFSVSVPAAVPAAVGLNPTAK
jgi:hypothetical protein